MRAFLDICGIQSHSRRIAVDLTFVNLFATPITNKQFSSLGNELAQSSWVMESSLPASTKKSGEFPGQRLNSRKRRKRRPQHRFGYWKKISPHELVDCPRLKPLSRAEEADLIQRAQRGDRIARERIWTQHLRLVLAAVDLEFVPTELLADAIQAGAMGIEVAIERYRVGSPYRFSVCALRCVRIRICRFAQLHATPIPMSRQQWGRFVRIHLSRVDGNANPAKRFRDGANSKQLYHLLRS